MSITKNCHSCEAKQAEINGLRDAVRKQGEFLQQLKALIAEFTTTDAQRIDVWRKRKYSRN